MDDIKFYTGEDFAIFGQIIEIEGQPQVSLDDLDVSFILSTTPLGKKIKGSTFPNSQKPLITRDKKYFGMNITGSESAEMTPGDATLSVAVIHKKSGAKIIHEQKILTIIESKGKNHEN